MINLFRYVISTIAIATCCATSIATLNYMFIEACDSENKRITKSYDAKIKELKDENERLKMLVDR